MTTAEEQLFENNILNRAFVVSYAIRNGNLLTSDYKGYTFVLLKNDYYHGTLKAITNEKVYTGSWKASENYGKLTILLPPDLPEFLFLSREWRFLSKKLPILKLAPWGEGNEISLHMTRL